MAVMTGPLVLAADVEIAPVAKLSARTRATLGARRGEYAITRPRGRAPAKVVSQAGAALLAEFRAPVPVVQVVRGIAHRDGRDAAELLDEAFPLLRDCFNDRFLVAAGSPDAAAILPSRERGDAIGPHEVLRCLRVLEDSELYQVRDGKGRVRAVKLVRRHAAPAVSAALAREASVLERLAGRGAPRLVARGRHRTRPWLAMTWCDGVAPEIAFGELRERGAPGRADLLRLAVSVTRAYARLHRAGVLHGDVHPGNLLIGRRGEVTLLDFGLARSVRGSRRAGPRLAGRAGAGGVTEYFAPEQATLLRAGRPLPAPTAASEQYAAAAMLYRLLAGAPAIAPAPGREELLRRIVESPVRRFSQAGAPPWPAVEAVLARALAKEPEGRYRGVAELARALRRAEAAETAGTSRRRDNPLAGVVEEFIAAASAPLARAPALPLSDTPAPTCSLMLGGAGTGLALLRLACARSDPATLALADVWLTRVERDMTGARAFEAPDEGLTLADLGAASPFHGAPGVHFVRTELARAMGDERAAAAACGRFLEASLASRGGLDLTMGSAGTLLAATRLLEMMPRNRERLRSALATLGNVSLDQLWRAEEWPDEPGIAHGRAGILYATLGWCAVTGRALPRAFTRRLRELADAAEPLGRGVRWTQPDVSAGPSIWASHEVAGWCNGPAGMTHLWLAAHERSRKEEHLSLAEGSGWSSWEARSGSTDLCCGYVGRAYALLALYRHTGRAEWLERARALAGLARARFGERREALERPLSLFKGIAGLALLAADLERPEAAAVPLFAPFIVDHPTA